MLFISTVINKHYWCWEPYVPVDHTTSAMFDRWCFMLCTNWVHLFIVRIFSIISSQVLFVLFCPWVFSVVSDTLTSSRDLEDTSSTIVTFWGFTVHLVLLNLRVKSFHQFLKFLLFTWLVFLCFQTNDGILCSHHPWTACWQLKKIQHICALTIGDYIPKWFIHLLMLLN